MTKTILINSLSDMFILVIILVSIPDVTFYFLEGKGKLLIWGTGGVFGVSKHFCSILIDPKPDFLFLCVTRSKDGPVHPGWAHHEARSCSWRALDWTRRPVSWVGLDPVPERSRPPYSTFPRTQVIPNTPCVKITSTYHQV